ncbi:MAG: hypothetical protein M3Q23_15625 [Actinomycetota bacterium]|nr:hypothetical protein [Actinomycetota bacterium]
MDASEQGRRAGPRAPDAGPGTVDSGDRATSSDGISRTGAEPRSDGDALAARWGPEGPPSGVDVVPALGVEGPTVAEEGPEPGPPVVRVSIGRIEVRVVPSPVTDAGSGPEAIRPTPALSLDEYLRRRNGRAP